VALLKNDLAKTKLPSILALVLLVIQIVLPWTVPHFVTQDGPSHVYSAVTARDLLIHRDSLQRFLYHFQPGILPNWTSTILIAAIATIAGATNAERVMVDICILAGFFSFQYAVRSLASVPRGFTPLANFLFNTWFLWFGLYNFALGMALCPLVIGYFVRHRRTLGIKNAMLLAAGTTLLFFTHLIPSAIAVLTVLTIALWTHARQALYRTSIAAAAMLPTIILIVLFAVGKPAVEWKPEVRAALAHFPMHIFVTAHGRAGEQTLLAPAILLYMVLATIGLRRDEWRSEKGALVAVSFISFGLYILVPDEGLGGSMTKTRFAWIVFILGGLVAASAARRLFEKPISLYIAVLMSWNLFVTWQALGRSSRAIEDYISATDRIPRGSVFVRILYPTPRTTEHYGLTFMSRDPFFHLDAYSASRRGAIDLSDYEALSLIFPLALRPRIGEGVRASLWALEGPGDRVADSLAWIREKLPVPIDYVVLVSDGDAIGLTSRLNSEMRLFATSPGNFVRVYQCLR
jgi:hypothetical protein